MTQDRGTAEVDEERGEGGSRPAPVPAPVQLRTDRLVLVGIGAWLVALVVVLLVPALRSGDRDWWPWACVSGAALGCLGYAYLRRGRGNAADAT
ncbi:hypothetical protein GCM10022199_10630 [Marihabitans asiaticum]|uniref:Uncharacterized protein DUF2530 n=1 Tax=Marihabitans asiaticum TaxID=415218 RepID=A0A560WHP1_9MICO|nr:DUF2530 domain-containing protein [Marihabitans asiaticum]TWD17080.1 uncharacterized protein DUF2530 [Marihabitans asiaticum]